jgi:hypothetical protein
MESGCEGVENIEWTINATLENVDQPPHAMNSAGKRNNQSTSITYRHHQDCNHNFTAALSVYGGGQVSPVRQCLAHAGPVHGAGSRRAIIIMSVSGAHLLSRWS